MSIVGGFHKAVEAAAKVGCDCVQFFTGNPRQLPTVPRRVRKGGIHTKNNNQWLAEAITDDDVDAFQQALSQCKIARPIAHACYLLNLASPDRALWKKSIDGLVVELQRADRLGISAVVLHPGAYTTSTEAHGLRRIARALSEVHRRTPGIGARCLLETTAGQGSGLGHRFEHLATILATVCQPERLGVCFDTCHVFAAGYPMAPQKLYRRTMRRFDDVVGLELIEAFHLNDSKREFGSCVDRHEHIGRGHLGREPFRLLLGDRRFRATPMYLETPKGKEGGKDLDAINLRVLRRLIRQPKRRTPKP